MNVNENIKTIFANVHNVDIEKKVPTILKTEDILNHATKTKQQKIEDVEKELNSESIFNYAGFEIIDEGSSVFNNQFMEETSLKQTIINMIKNCRYLSGK